MKGQYRARQHCGHELHSEQRHPFARTDGDFPIQHDKVIIVDNV